MKFNYFVLIVIFLTFIVLGMTQVLPKYEARNEMLEQLK